MTLLDQADVARVFRAEYGRAVAVLVRLLGDIDLAEEAVQEAFVAAVRRWPEAGLPPSARPAGSSRRPATGRSTGTAGSRPATPGTPRPRVLHVPDDPVRRRVPCATTGSA